MDLIFLPKMGGSGDGTPGAPGSVWRIGHGAPSNSLGVDGDFYINADNGDYYQKISGVYVFQGNLTGPPGPSGGAGSYICVFRESPSGVLDGVNVDFTLAHTPNNNTEEVFLNGLLQDESNDYTISSATITFVNPPNSFDRIRVNYQYTP